MSKLWSLKRWLPLWQAAESISTLTDGFEVAVVDILQLALERQIRLSVVFPEGALARLCNSVDADTINYTDVPNIEGIGQVRLYEGGQIFYAPGGQAFQVTEKVVRLGSDDSYELLMIGAEKSDVQRQFWSLSGQEVEETWNLDGTFVFDRQQPIYFQLVDTSVGSDGERFYFPAGNLPEKSVLVIPSSEIQRFISAIAEPSRSPPACESSRWPWGAHNTRLLDHLEAAAQRFWVNFDPSDRTTAPTNAAVETWLVDRGVSQRSARNIASILRADGLPPGPRASS